MAVEKALDLSNPLVASRVSLEETLDRFVEVFKNAGATLARRRLGKWAAPISFDFSKNESNHL